MSGDSKAGVQDFAGSEHDRQMWLRDGRRLSYREIGDSGGRPVLALHGTPGSRLMYAVAHGAAIRAGLRLIAPDRWGYGGTDLHPQPSLRNWAADTAEMVDQLGLSRFSVLGISGGGPYAVSTAAAFGNRIEALALAVPVGPIAETGSARQLGLLHRIAFRWAGPHPRVIRRTFGLFRRLLRRSPQRAVPLIGLATSESDRKMLNTATIRDYLGATFNAGLEPGVEGPAIDMRIFTSPWDIPFERISAPTRIWTGRQDRIVPASGIQELRRALPNAQVVEFASEGHFWIARDYPVILEWLAEIS